MKKLGWGILFVFMVLLIWNTRVTVPVSAEAIGFDLWAVFLIFLTFLVGRKLWFSLSSREILSPDIHPASVAEKLGQQELKQAGEEMKEGDDEIEEVDEPCVRFNLTDERMEKNYGWDRINVYPKRYERSSCSGGPPNFEEVCEYSVQDQKVYVRLVDSETGDFFKTTDEHSIVEVKDGLIVEESMKILDAEDDYCHLARLDRRRDLKFATTWHEVHDPVIRYVLWATKNSRDILIAENARLNAAFFAVDSEAKKLGGSRDKYGSYTDADGKIDEPLKALQTDEGLAVYGISRNDFFEQEKILKVLTQAIEQKK